ncbi:L,D-transpeptidase family protein [Pontibacter sp. JAM-7]|uniref:L,D-transpeptidase family protein n=1 Tax=Pontibacter sp. JAM-7 TaxID=3366581 RepID=UPI003AF4381F
MTQRIEVSISQQTLRLLEDSHELAVYPVSTALNGAGERESSGCTPRGGHYIRAKIGDAQPINSVFVGRRPTGEIYSSELALMHPQRDWILTRILWLCGTETGFNRLGSVDSMRRYIYIHGTPDSEPMGKPLSHGCIRMRNQAILELFDRVAVGTAVDIQE